MKKTAWFLIIASVAFQVQAGKTISVPKDVKSIAAALEKAEPGDTVFVAKGTYKESIALRDQVALIGEAVNETVVQGSRHGAVVKGADNAVLKNFTIRGGEKGILCENVSMLIEQNVVSNNSGTGIHCLVTLPMIRNNVVSQNGWTGIYCETVRSLNTIIEHNVIAENNYSGIMLAGSSEVIIQNNVLIGNKQFGVWVNEGARRSRIIYNNFYMNRSPYNNFAQIDRTDISVDPGYRQTGGVFNTSDFFSTPSPVLKGKGRDGGDIGLISVNELQRKEHDQDNDGIPDDKDKCPTIPEDKDGFQDDDGCPDFDNDNDGIYDTKDQCPDLPEDFDGYQDKDGCPDYDNDKDGIPDSVDVCPNNPETMNGYKDTDGCPDEVPAMGAQEKTQPQTPAAPAAPAPAVAPQKTTQPTEPDTAKKTAVAAPAKKDSTKIGKKAPVKQ